MYNPLPIVLDPICEYFKCFFHLYSLEIGSYFFFFFLNFTILSGFMMKARFDSQSKFPFFTSFLEHFVKG